MGKILLNKRDISVDEEDASTYTEAYVYVASFDGGLPNGERLSTQGRRGETPEIAVAKLTESLAKMLGGEIVWVVQE